MSRRKTVTCLALLAIVIFTPYFINRLLPRCVFVGWRAPNCLTIRVLDPQGRPIPGAKLRGRRGDPSLWELVTWTETSKDDSAVTDAKGEAKMKLGWDLQVQVTANGYYPQLDSWDARDFPPETVTVTLQPENARVPMKIYPLAFRKWKRTISEGELDTVSSGIDFSAPIDDPLKRFTDDRETAQFWIEAAKSLKEPEGVASKDLSRHERLQSGWRLRITGLGGWTVAAGPKRSGDGKSDWSDPAMHLAPEEGYLKSLEYRADEFPRRLFVRSPDGQRYGSFTRIGFGVEISPEKAEVTLGASMALQEKAVGSRSLNPENPPSAY